MAKTNANPSVQADINQIAQALFDEGKHVKVNGVVGHKSGQNTASMTLALGAIFTLAGLVWPLFALAALAAIVGSAIADVDGGRGWIRSLLVADATHNLVVWTDDCAPGKPYTPKPTLLIAGPIESHDSINKPGHSWLIFHIISLLASGISIAASTWFGTYPATVCAGLLAISSIVLQIKNWMSKRDQVDNPARLLWLRSLERCAPTSKLRIVWALVGGGNAHNDGLRTLLLNHRTFLPPDQTRVLALHPTIGVCSWVGTEGKVQPVAADPLLGALLGKSGIPTSTDATAARTALRLGWPAASLSVSTDQVHLGTRVVCDAIANAEELCEANEW